MKLVDNRIYFYYGALSFFKAILHNVFLLYHVDVFFSIYKIDKTSFWLSEIIFLIWNSCNDPLFGWLSDKKFLNNKVTLKELIVTRLSTLQISGPLLAVVFTFFWFKWSPPLFQFICCLCAYDGLLTLFDLHHSALLADFTTSTRERTKLNMFSSFFSAISAFFVFFSYFFWDVEHFHSFQMFVFFTAAFSFIGFFFFNTRLKQIYSKSYLKQQSIK